MIEIRREQMGRGMTLKRRLSAWLTLSRLPFHTVGVLPFLLGIVIAWDSGYPIKWTVLALSIFAVVLIMLMTYYVGEYYDYESDSTNKEFNKYSGGSRALVAGSVPKRHPLIAGYVCLGLAIIIGLVLQFYYKTGVYTIPLGSLGLLCGFFYSGKPLQWSRRGAGEPLIALCYGWLCVNTAYYLQVGRFDLLPTLLSIPIGITIFLVILINEFPDYTSDKASGRKNLVVRFGKEAMASLYSWLMVVSYLTIVSGYWYNIPQAIIFLSLPILALMIWNILAIRRKGYKSRKVLEGLCARTILVNLLITGMYILGFTIW